MKNSFFFLARFFGAQTLNNSFSSSNIDLKAVYICSENKGSMPNVKEAQYVFMTPEQTVCQQVKKMLASRIGEVKLLVIDEAHCISESTETFRPDYLKLGTFKIFLRAPVMALTATPTSAVRAIIPKTLAIPECALVEGSLDRPELFIEFRLVNGLVHLDPDLLEELGRVKDLAVVFCGSKVQACSLYEEAKRTMGKDVGVFHASLTQGQKTKVIGRMMQGVLRVAFVTAALGMGMNFPGLHWVLYWGQPRSILELAQYFGRASRDRSAGKVTLIISKQAEAGKAMLAPRASPLPAPSLKSQMFSFSLEDAPPSPAPVLLSSSAASLASRSSLAAASLPLEELLITPGFKTLKVTTDTKGPEQKDGEKKEELKPFMEGNSCKRRLLLRSGFFFFLLFFPSFFSFFFFFFFFFFSLKMKSRRMATLQKP